MIHQFINQDAADINCPICGIEGNFDSMMDAIFCTQCGGIFDLASRELIADISTPDQPALVVPFEYSEEEAKREVSNQIAIVKHADKKYVQEMSSIKWRAVYVPCYIVKNDAVVSLSGRGTYKRSKDIVHETVEAIIRFGFKEVPVFASKGLSRDMAEDTGEFPLSKAKEYSGESVIDGVEVLPTDFLPRKNPQIIWRRLNKLMRDVATKQNLDYDEFIPDTSAMITDYSNFDIVFALVPIYIIEMPEKHYFVNGVTGRLTGLDMIPLTPWWQDRKMHPNKTRTAIKITELILMVIIGLLGVCVGWHFSYMVPLMIFRYSLIISGLIIVCMFLIGHVPWLFDKMFPVPKEYIKDDTLIYLNPSAKMTWTKESELIAVTTSEISADKGYNFFMYMTKLFWPD
ncbi:MAG: hypothetical protein MJ094_02905 [Saccharofermentans sp.]|nr:hypothetical protein [Saccharofermentans sp.]